jgi:hypothetical protein
MSLRTLTLALGLTATLTGPRLGGQVLDTSRASQKRPVIDTTLDQLRTPASPAFILIGVAPSAVERPTTPKALAATIVSAAAGVQSLPTNYAIEVAPYWLSSHPGLTWEQFQHPGTWPSLIHNLSLSLAISSSSPIFADSGTAVGFGLRTFVSTSKADTSLIARLDAIQQQQNGYWKPPPGSWPPIRMMHSTKERSRASASG